MDLTFLGAAGTVTGSRFLLRTGQRTVLVDCGLFQGLKELRLRNREPFPVDPASIGAVVLTHAHLDHTGYLPLLVRNGFRGPVYCSEVTQDLCEILLRDAAHIQEEEADFANRHGTSRHRPALPLFTQHDVRETLRLLRPVPMRAPVDLGGEVAFRMTVAGHLFGAACVSLESEAGVVLFSGDVGRLDEALLPAPEVPGPADWLVLESTYGDRRHPPGDPADALAEVVLRTVGRGGVLLIPSFAVGRAQLLLLLLYRLKRDGRIPDVPIFLDSPMAASAMEVLVRHPTAHRLTEAEARAVCASARVVASVAESKAVDRMSGPRVVVSASGMLTGGRVLHHLAAFAADPRNTVLFAGYQAPGTRGARLVGGARDVKLLGRWLPLRAQVQVLDGLSGHADYEELLTWLAGFPAAPKGTFLTHGEPAAAEALRMRIEDRLGWTARAAEDGARVVLEGAPIARGQPANG